MKTINRIFLLLAACRCMQFRCKRTRKPILFSAYNRKRSEPSYSIASMYNISQADIVKLNPGSDDKIYVGRTLRIPRTDANCKRNFPHHRIR